MQKIPRIEKLNREEIEESVRIMVTQGAHPVLEYLSELYGCTVPYLEVNAARCDGRPKPTRALYSPKNMRITIRERFCTMYDLLHEFCHHVQWFEILTNDQGYFDYFNDLDYENDPYEIQAREFEGAIDTCREIEQLEE